MRLAFAGTPEFALASLQALHAAGHEVVAVLTQPDRPAGRGLKLQPSPVKQWALTHSLPVHQPRSLRLDGRFPEDAATAAEALRQARPDVLVVAAYGLILPRWTLELAPHGALNVHGSLLPRWRGAAPIHRAIEAGDTLTGITIMQMDEGLDTGPMALKGEEAIGPEDTTGALHDRLAGLGGRLIVDALAREAAGTLLRTPQPTEGVTYAHKIDKAEAAIDWRQPAATIERRLRAFDPFPGGQTRLGDETVKVWRGRCVAGEADGAPPGTVLSSGPDGVVVACGEGALALTTLQSPGGRRLPAAAWLGSHPVAPGTTLG
ncbi:MAG: methionyl-tRNA formyltransferase [Rubrivivax sp.]|jgi:methionyl-tRNA formyltransferase